MRKTDRGKKGGQDRGEAKKHPHPFFSLQIWTGGARKLERELNIARLWGRGRNPAASLQSTFFGSPFFFPLFLFIVDQPVREGERASEKVRRERASGGSLGEIAVQSCLEHQPHSTVALTPTGAHSPAVPRRVPGLPGPGSHQRRLAPSPTPGARAPSAPRPPPSRPPRAPG